MTLQCTRLYLTFFILVAISAHSHDTSLEVSNEHCNFYIQLEEKWECENAPTDASNYLLGYGFKYCARFLRASETWDGALKQWTRDTMLCLQTALLMHEEEMETCVELEQLAFDSHPTCYVDNGFCELTTSEKLEVLSYLNRLDLLMKPKHSMVQAISLLSHCTGDIDFSKFDSATCTLF